MEEKLMEKENVGKFSFSLKDNKEKKILKEKGKENSISIEILKELRLGP